MSSFTYFTFAAVPGHGHRTGVDATLFSEGLATHVTMSLIPGISASGLIRRGALHVLQPVAAEAVV